MNPISLRRVRAVAGKELRDYSATVPWSPG